MALTEEQRMLQQAALAATPGPWTYSPMGETTDPEIGASNGSRVALLVAADMTKQNSRFIAAANPDAILALLAQVEAMPHWRGTMTVNSPLVKAHRALEAMPSVPAQTGTVSDELSVMLWLYRRLPRCYARPPFVERAITSMAKRAGTDVAEFLAERNAAAPPTPEDKAAGERRRRPDERIG